LFGELVKLLIPTFRLSGLLPKLVGPSNDIHVGNFCHLLLPKNRPVTAVTGRAVDWSFGEG
jgi:hypothetical protein